MNKTAIADSAYTYISIGDAGAPGPVPPAPPPGFVTVCALTNATAKKKKADVTSLLIVLIRFYFKILVLTVSPLSETIFTTYEFLSEPSSSITKSVEVLTAFLEITSLPLIS